MSEFLADPLTGQKVTRFIPLEFLEQANIAAGEGGIALEGTPRCTCLPFLWALSSDVFDVQ